MWDVAVLNVKSDCVVVVACNLQVDTVTVSLGNEVHHKQRIPIQVFALAPLLHHIDNLLARGSMIGGICHTGGHLAFN